MMFYSTNKNSPKVSFETALMQGLAPDGGLYFPESFPEFSPRELTNMVHSTLIDIGVMVMKKWVNNSIDHSTLQTIIKKSLDFPIKLRSVGPYYVLELFHGPTMSFKDIAAKTLANLLSHYLQKEKKKITLLVATSGDTGGAIAHGFADIEEIKVVVLYPKGKVSVLQKEQLTRVAKNVTSIAVDGNFDDTLHLVKQAFTDPELQNLNLTSANSISIGRLLPQIIYYAYVYGLLNSDKIQFVVPTGNMGNITAGLFAAEMSLPFTDFIAAFNANDPVVRYYETGEYEPKVTMKTFSNAMDVGNPSNFIRIMELFDQSHETFKAYVKADSITDKETVDIIKRIYLTYNYLLDPHTAVAWATAEHLASPQKIPVIMATASPVKFASEIAQRTGIEVDDKEEIAKLKSREKRVKEMANNYETFKKILQNQ